MDIAVNDRVNKARQASVMINKKLIFNKGANIIIKLRLYNALKVSILTYGIQIIPTSQKLINKLQKFQSDRIRYITNNNYDYNKPNEN